MPPRHDEASPLEHPQMLHDAEASHRQPRLERASTCRIRESSGHIIHEEMDK